MSTLGHFDWHKTPNRWIVCGCGQSFKERERAVHIHTEAHEKWVNSASAFTLAAFVTHHHAMDTPKEPAGEKEGRAPIQPSSAPALTPAHAKSPLLKQTENRCDKTPGPTPATVYLLPSPPPSTRHRDLFHPHAAAESPVVPRKETFKDEQ